MVGAGRSGTCATPRRKAASWRRPPREREYYSVPVCACQAGGVLRSLARDLPVYGEPVTKWGTHDHGGAVFDLVRAARARDPAARGLLGVFEVIFTYPGVHAMASHRVAHALWRAGVPIVPQLMSQLSRFFTGVEIHPGAVIGRGFFIDHGMGVVIGETTIIGDNVTLYQGVTLGGTGRETGKRHPTLGNDIVVGCGARVLGGITIGNDVRICTGSVVVRPVPDDCTVVGIPGRIVREGDKRVTDAPLAHGAIPDPVLRELGELEARLKWLEGGSRGKTGT
ncbi:serine O-acetyltransferase [bacterium]|nr:serine O-acetyltransferase [bacterium]